VPRVRTDLPWTLTGDAAVWIESKEPSSGTYHLHHPRGDKNCPAIEYINKDWFYLNKEKGKYYTGPLSRITTPNILGLGTYRTLSPTATPILESSTETPSVLPPRQAAKLSRCECDPSWFCSPHDACFIHESCLCEGSSKWPPVKPVRSRWVSESREWLAALLSCR